VPVSGADVNPYVGHDEQLKQKRVQRRSGTEGDAKRI
jgi:hypothetical protein